mgnify:CR=1 FL=1
MEKFISAAGNVGADVQVLANLEELVTYIADRCEGRLMISSCPSLLRAGVPARLEAAGLDLVDEDFRSRGADAAAGLTLSLIHISEPTRPAPLSRMPSSA